MTKLPTKSETFIAAWAFARKAAAKFGGVAREYFAASLRKAYAEIRVLAEKLATEAAPAELTTAQKVTALAGIVQDWSREYRKSFAYNFVLDNAERVHQYGDATKFSPKQAAVIGELYTKYAR